MRQTFVVWKANKFHFLNEFANLMKFVITFYLSIYFCCCSLFGDENDLWIFLLHLPGWKKRDHILISWREGGMSIKALHMFNPNKSPAVHGISFVTLKLTIGRTFLRNLMTNIGNILLLTVKNKSCYFNNLPPPSSIISPSSPLST